MGQAASSDQTVFQHFGERGEVSDSVYVLVAIVKKHLSLDSSLYTLLQIFLGDTLRKIAFHQAVTGTEYKPSDDAQCTQLNLFAF
jgi:hypothetical protein